MSWTLGDLMDHCYPVGFCLFSLNHVQKENCFCFVRLFSFSIKLCWVPFIDDKGTSSRYPSGAHRVLKLASCDELNPLSQAGGFGGFLITSTFF